MEQGQRSQQAGCFTLQESHQHKICETPSDPRPFYFDLLERSANVFLPVQSIQEGANLHALYQRVDEEHAYQNLSVLKPVSGSAQFKYAIKPCHPFSEDLPPGDPVSLPECPAWLLPHPHRILG